MSESNFAVDLGTLDLTQMSPIGLEYTEPTGFIDLSCPAASRNAASRGKRTWIYVQIAAGTTLAAGNPVIRAAGTSTYENCLISALDSSPERIVGIAQRALGNAAVSYGWLLREGVGLYLADTAGVTADRPLIAGNAVAGTVDDSTGTTTDNAKSFGWSITTALATATGTARFRCRG